ncbi:hypothetical protein CAL7716_084670 [Calothrix sp. PCC 7716]|nr:hypothetical protein CAL7716_084670 [Calothrix sp. PCC 7716]
MTLRHSLAFLDTQTGQLVEAGKHEQLLEKKWNLYSVVASTIRSKVILIFFQLILFFLQLGANCDITTCLLIWFICTYRD